MWREKLTKNCIIFLGTSASIPQKNKFTQSIAICALKECVILDAGEGMQIRMSEIGIDHRMIKLIAISHAHGDHVHGLLPFIETLKMKLVSQKINKNNVLNIVAPLQLCTYINNFLKFFRIEDENILKIMCIDAQNLWQRKEKICTPSGEISVLPLRVEHGDLEEAYGFYVELLMKKKSVNIFYSGDGMCGDRCLEDLIKLKPSIIIHEATFLDYPEDRIKAYSSGHATVYEAAVLATKVNAYVLILTHISARYSKNDVNDFIARTRKVFQGEVFVAEDLAKIPLDLLNL